MPISPVGSVIYANQMLAVQAMKQADTQHALILQNSAAVAIENEKETTVHEVVAAEESYHVNPDKEHERQKNDEENKSDEKQHSQKISSSPDEKESQDATQKGLLDIKA